MFRFVLTIATSVFLLATGTDNLFAIESMDDHNRTNNKALASIYATNSSKFSLEMETRIIEYAAFGQCMNNKKPVNLMLVCKDWYKETERCMHPRNPCWKAWNGIIGHEDIYETFLNGVLIYQQDPNSDEGIVLKISDLTNPLEGTFDLSECGDMGKYLVISTGYRKRINPDNKCKTEIWIAPRFLIAKDLSTTSKHFSKIEKEWYKNALVGIFFTCAHQSIEYMDCCITKDLKFISENNLFSIWGKSRPGLPNMGMGGNAEQVWMRSDSRGFNVRFDVDKKTLGLA